MAEPKRHMDVPQGACFENILPIVLARSARPKAGSSQVLRFPKIRVDQKSHTPWDCFSNKLTANPR